MHLQFISYYVIINQSGLCDLMVERSLATQKVADLNLGQSAFW